MLLIAGLEKPVVIDEAQRVRKLFLAIKEDVDRNRAPGRYLLTGSANILTIPKVADALAGRMELLTLWPPSISELKEGGENILDAFFDRSFPNRFHPRTDFNGLRLLREHLGDRFVRGILIYAGREIAPFEKDLHAVPVNVLTGRLSRRRGFNRFYYFDLVLRTRPLTFRYPHSATRQRGINSIMVTKAGLEFW